MLAIMSSSQNSATMMCHRVGFRLHALTPHRIPIGHLYFYLVGKDPRHGGATQSVNGNIELEQHIQKRENESIENFNNQ